MTASNLKSREWVSRVGHLSPSEIRGARAFVKDLSQQDVSVLVGDLLSRVDAPGEVTPDSIDEVIKMASDTSAIFQGYSGIATTFDRASQFSAKTRIYREAMAGRSFNELLSYIEKSESQQESMDAGDIVSLTKETLRVSKREESLSTARVRSYLIETPVHEQVNLQEEHVTVERRVAPKPESTEKSGFLEVGEEAVIAKDARVVEEVVIRKEANKRTGEIVDTVRQTEVEVTGAPSRPRNAPSRPTRSTR